MEEKFKQFLKKQMEEEAEQIEKEVLSNESLKGIQAPDTLREALAKSIKEYEEKRAETAKTHHGAGDCEISEEVGISIEEFCEKLPEEDRESYLRWRAAEESKENEEHLSFPEEEKSHHGGRCDNGAGIGSWYDKCRWKAILAESCRFDVGK